MVISDLLCFLILKRKQWKKVLMQIIDRQLKVFSDTQSFLKQRASSVNTTTLACVVIYVLPRNLRCYNLNSLSPQLSDQINQGWGNSLVVQWLKPCGFNAEGMGLIPGAEGNWSSYKPHSMAKTNKWNKAEVTLHQYASPYPKVSKASLPAPQRLLPLTPESYLSSERKEV